MLATAWPAAGPGSAAGDAAGWVTCPALSASGGSLRTLPDAEAITGGGGEETAFFIRTRGAACPQVQQVLAAVLQSGDESTALGAGGYRLLQSHHERPLAGHAAYSVEAGRERPASALLALRRSDRYRPFDLPARSMDRHAPHGQGGL